MYVVQIIKNGSREVVKELRAGSENMANIIKDGVERNGEYTNYHVHIKPQKGETNEC